MSPRPAPLLAWISTAFRSPIVVRVCLACASFAFYYAVLAGGNYLPDRDAYFHIRIAAEILEHGFVASIPQMAHSIHADRYVDFHFLFHYALTPFVVVFGDPLLAMRVATAAFAALAVFALDASLTAMRVRHRWFWCLAFVLLSPIFTGRLLFGRGVTLLLGLLFYFVTCLFRGRLRSAAVVAAVSVWTYPGFPVLGGFAVLLWIADALRRGRFRAAPLLWPAAGMLCAVIIHPAFPHQFYGYWLEYVVHTLRPAEVESIAEWLPPPASILVPGLAAPVAVLLATLLGTRRHDAQGAALLVASTFFVFASAISLKPFEYALPFLILYCARQTRGLFAATAGRTSRVARAGGFRAMRALAEALYVAIAAGLLIWSVPEISRRMVLQYRAQDPSHHFAAADWLRMNVSAGALVALAWDQFPLFYFRDPGRRYLFGLNPVYSYGADAGRYALSRRLYTPNGYAAGPAQSAASPLADLHDLGAQYAVFDRRRDARVLVTLLDRAPSERVAGRALAVYQNARFIIVRVPGATDRSP